MKRQAIPWAVVGFVFGAFVGVVYGGRASSNLSAAVDTSINDGDVVVRIDPVKILASGF